MRLLQTTQAGDTIIEVMIAMAIIGISLAGAYATANHSLSDVRDAQEHEQATTLAESEAELLNTVPTATLTNASSPFCFTLNPANLNSIVTGSQCTSLGEDNLYTVAIDKTTDSNPSIPLPTYTIDVSWLKLGGGNDDTKIYYQPDPSL